MMRFLHKTSFIFVFYFLLSSATVVGQYTITGNVNASSLTCGTFTGVSIIYVGNGVASASLVMDADLNLTTCGLSGIQLIVRNNASLVFPDKTNNTLSLPANSSIVIESGTPGGAISTVGSCSASDLITVGGVKVASCQGGSSLYDFDQIVANGGYNYVKTVSSPQCSSSAGSIAVSVFPAPSASTTYKLFTTLVGGTAVSTAVAGAAPYNTTINTPTLTTTTTLYVEATTGSITTARKPVVVTVNPSNTVSAASSTPTLCANTLMTNITHSTTGATGIGTVTGLPAGVTAVWTSNTITISGTPTASGTFNYSIPLTGGCGTINATGIITVNVAPIITTQPLSQLDCEGSSVNFKALAVGTNLTYTWFYKRPTDASFIMLSGVVSNTTYPNAPINNEISLANVGGTQYPNGTQFQVTVSNVICGVTSNTVVLSVNEIVAINSPALSPSQSVVDVKLCYGSNYSYTAVISNPSNGPVTYQWKSQIPSGSWNNVIDGPHFSGAKTAVLNIINGTPAESGKYRVDVVYNRTGGSCSVSSFSKVRSLTFYPSLTTPDVVISQPDCITNTGVITVRVQSTTDTYSFDNGLNYQASNVKSGLAAGTYNVFIKNIDGCISPVKISTINVAPIPAIWNGTIWTNGPPTSTQAVVFNGNYRSSVNGGDLVACSCQVNSGTVIFDNGNSLKVTNKVTVSGGSLEFYSQSSLVQINNVSNSGNITYNRTLNGPITKFDYTYWSSPVSPQTLYNVSPFTGDKFYSFDGASYAWVQVPSSTVMAPGIGYIIRGPEPQTGAIPLPVGFFNAPFIGVPNNGPIQVAIAASTDAAYLLGNPYPSALYADKFIKDNPVLEGTLYFWTHNTTIGTNVSNPGSGVYAYSGDDYASYNLTGGAAAGTGTAATATGYNNTVPSGNIGSGQGFFASTKGAGTVTFDNTMRVGANGAALSNSEFFKMQVGNKTDLVEKNRIWLNMFNTAGAFKQTLVGYVTGATNDIEGRYDGESFDGYEFLDFYSINQEKNLVIQGRGLPFDENDTIPLGFRSGIEGDFTIAIDQVDGLFKDQNIFIKDKLLNVIHDLKNNSYTFTTTKGVFNDRFVLFYTNKKASAVASTLDALSKLILVSTSEKEIRITSSLSMDAVRLYDLSGKEIFNKTKVNNTELAIRNLRKGNTVYVIKIKLDDGQTVTHKVIY
ncbi:T9SS type A sorting domain-containing protein [Flavobacterium sp. F-380]|uniref:T9SS type A sorting domain-containing protein n=1 Tax=Flavobacterium kayseriense TaxID=2764714 RepID=A0ABR7J558_9FLAO|nr:T9SS sorting signal type C domain-containing protein [Flavobacterium kayseriense]MBC5840680.1 T9SS type A sorting domain-containing protein [Flavobacterium kayseriense]MBC5846650.1 T9SS type A sorting domain-containing protein [Flavobacterium kayseriense]